MAADNDVTTIDPLAAGLKAIASKTRLEEDGERTAVINRSTQSSLQNALKAAEAALAPVGRAAGGDAATILNRPPKSVAPPAPAKTQLVRGGAKPARANFHQDPVVGWLVVIGGPGLGSFRPIFEGNNTIGRSAGQRIPIDFGDDAISGEEQAFLRYDSSDRGFLLVPNLAKTNVIAVNELKPTAAVKLAAMDVITMGRTQLVFVPFCGEDFDWSELAGMKE